MGSRVGQRATGFVLVLASVGVSATGAAGPGGREAGDQAVVGARSLGDPLLPQLGNGGYDVEHYRIELDYDPVANRFDDATTTIVAVAAEQPPGVQPRLPGRPRCHAA